MKYSGKITKQDNENETLSFWEKKKGIVCLWAIAIVVCLTIWVFGALFTHKYAIAHFKVNCQDNAPALFGDSFGAVNALLSAFAFAGMIVTFFLQRRELRYQREELKDQKDEFKTQNATLKLQRFESTFFNMMNLQQQIVNELTIEYSYVHSEFNRAIDDFSHENRHMAHKGRKVFEVIFMGDKGDNGNVSGLKKSFQTKGMAFYDDAYSRTALDHYFLHFFHILGYIDNSTDVFASLGHTPEEIESEKQKYASTLRATLSRYELVLLYYHCLSHDGKTHKSLVEKYHMLSNLNRYLLTLSKETIDHINKELGKTYNAEEITAKLQSLDLSGRDYEFHLSVISEPKKIRITAFSENDGAPEIVKDGRSAIDAITRWKDELEAAPGEA